MSSLPFGPATLAWFEANFAGPTSVQAQGWPLLASGKNVLLLAPTGSGKTLAAFLASIDRLMGEPPRGVPEKPARAKRGAPKGPPALPEGAGVRVLYISPLKALVYDIERNLRAPLRGIAHYADRAGLQVSIPRIAIRTGDTPAIERARQRKDPAEILVTTPESLFLMLGSQIQETLKTVETIIIDEIHSLAPTKRGVHLALSLERLAQICEKDPQRIGLSATVRPPQEVARFLVGSGRDVEIIDTLVPPRLDLQIVSPVPDMENPDLESPDRTPDSILGQLMAQETIKANKGHGQAGESATSLWPAIYPQLLQLILEHRSTILFVNSRGLCERLSLRLNELAGEELVRAHHGSVSHEERQQIEEQLKGGTLRGLVATSSLELGIDMGAVDLVIMVESPGSVARGLQRVGRAGHGVGETSIGRIFPKFRGALVECAVVVDRMLQGSMEPIRIPRNPLDVLCQHLAAMIAQAPQTVVDLEKTVRASAPYSDLARELLVECLEMLSGRYPSTEFADLRPRVNWDRDSDILSPRPGLKNLTLVNGGTIPDRGTYGVYMGGQGGPRVGELDEEMVHEVRAGQNFLLGATTWRIEEITRDKVYVTPAPGEPGRLPFWKGEGPGRPIELGKAMGVFLEELNGRLEGDADAWLQENYRLDEWARGNLLNHLREQKEMTGSLPTHRRITVERFRDELGDWRVCIITPFGARVHAPWALALESILSQQAGFEVQTLYTDDGIVLRIPDVEEFPELPGLAPDPEEVEELVITQLANSPLFASQFRENAGRALLLPRKMPGQRTPLWSQRLKAQNLLGVARNYPSFPLMLETFRSCLQDVFDIASLKEVLGDIRSRKIRVDNIETPSPSPFARSLVFSFVAAFLYAGDAPLAERKVQALTLDRNLLRELLGQEELRELLDASVLEDLEAEMQMRAEGWQVAHYDALHDALRRLGDMTQAEVEERCTELPFVWLEMLEKQRRIVKMRIGGEPRWVAVEDVGLYRDALGCVPPSGLPNTFLTEVPQASEALLARFGRTHGPFVSKDLATRYGLPVSAVDSLMKILESRRVILNGEFRPGGQTREWCDPEFLRRWRQRTLAKLRGQVVPVEAARYAKFLFEWHQGQSSLLEIVGQLEGLPMSFQELEKSILPPRLKNYHPRWLDELCQMGSVVWVGHGPLGNRDGRIALYRRERLAALLEPPVPEELAPAQQAIVEHLDRRGATFFMELRTALKDRFKAEELEEALEDLIWAGRVTNDLLTPLRGLAVTPTKRNRLKTPPFGGRWTLVGHILEGMEQVGPTMRQHAWAQTLMERYGIVSREVASAENLPGGFSAIYQIFRAMEESGKVRRGYFVESLSAAQFAYSAAVDQLRAPAREDDVQFWTLAANDPANPYGALFPWPENSGRPRRAVGCRVVIARGHLLFYLDKGARKMISFPACVDENLRELGIRALAELADVVKGKVLRLQEVDGQPANQTPWTAEFIRNGFTSEFYELTKMGRV